MIVVIIYGIIYVTIYEPNFGPIYGKVYDNIYDVRSKPVYGKSLWYNNLVFSDALLCFQLLWVGKSN